MSMLYDDNGVDAAQPVESRLEVDNKVQLPDDMCWVPMPYILGEGDTNPNLHQLKFVDKDFVDRVVVGRKFDFLKARTTKAKPSTAPPIDKRMLGKQFLQPVFADHALCFPTSYELTPLPTPKAPAYCGLLWEQKVSSGSRKARRGGVLMSKAFIPRQVEVTNVQHDGEPYGYGNPLVLFIRVPGSMNRDKLKEIAVQAVQATPVLNMQKAAVAKHYDGASRELKENIKYFDTADGSDAIMMPMPSLEAVAYKFATEQARLAEMSDAECAEFAKAIGNVVYSYTMNGNKYNEETQAFLNSEGDEDVSKAYMTSLHADALDPKSVRALLVRMMGVKEPTAYITGLYTASSHLYELCPETTGAVIGVELYVTGKMTSHVWGMRLEEIGNRLLYEARQRDSEQAIAVLGENVMGYAMYDMYETMHASVKYAGVGLPDASPTTFKNPTKSQKKINTAQPTIAVVGNDSDDATSFGVGSVMSFASFAQSVRGSLDLTFSRGAGTGAGESTAGSVGTFGTFGTAGTAGSVGTVRTAGTVGTSSLPVLAGTLQEYQSFGHAPVKRRKRSSGAGGDDEGDGGVDPSALISLVMKDEENLVSFYHPELSSYKLRLPDQETVKRLSIVPAFSVAPLANYKTSTLCNMFLLNFRTDSLAGDMFWRLSVYRPSYGSVHSSIYTAYGLLVNHRLSSIIDGADFLPEEVKWLHSMLYNVVGGQTWSNDGSWSQPEYHPRVDEKQTSVETIDRMDLVHQLYWATVPVWPWGDDERKRWRAIARMRLDWYSRFGVVIMYADQKRPTLRKVTKTSINMFIPHAINVTSANLVEVTSAAEKLGYKDLAGCVEARLRFMNLRTSLRFSNPAEPTNFVTHTGQPGTDNLEDQDESTQRMPYYGTV